MTKYYLDTSILLDYYEKRGRNGEIALILINKIRSEDILIYSDAHVMELKGLGYSKNEINKILMILKSGIKHVHINKGQLEEARRLISYIRIPVRDALHAILARDNEAILVSNDKHFQLLKYIVEIKKPLELTELFL